jgi:hypothetical protein
MTAIAALAREVATLETAQLPAAALLREIERVAHALAGPAAQDLRAATPEDLRALHRAVADLKSRIAARAATLTVLRDALRETARARRPGAGTYDSSGARR